MYGHLNLRSLILMHMKKMVYNVPKIKISKKLCEECYVAKHTRNSFKHEFPTKSKKKLEIYQSDACGSFEVN